MRFIFMGTAEFACPTLQSLIASPHEALAVVTQPDRPRGRGRQPAMSAVKQCALVHHLPVLQPLTLRSSNVVDQLVEYQADVIVVVAYGNILPQQVLELPLYGCVNLHASVLPKYRGAAPINWMLINGESETGYTIIQMDAAVDTGPMLRREIWALGTDEDAISLGKQLAIAGAQGMVEVLTDLERGLIIPEVQPTGGVSMAPKLTRELGYIDWQQEARMLYNLIRALVPWPGCLAMFGDVELKIWQASVYETLSTDVPGTVRSILPEGLLIACGTHHLLVREIQPVNRRRMSARDFALGYRVKEGDCFA